MQQAPADLPLGYYRVLFTMHDSEHEGSYDLFYHLPGGWQFYQGLGEWVEMDEDHFLHDLEREHRAFPERIEREEAQTMMLQIDQEESGF